MPPVFISGIWSPYNSPGLQMSTSLLKHKISGETVRHVCPNICHLSFFCHLVFICYGVGGVCCNPNGNPTNMQLCGLLPYAIPNPVKINHEDVMSCPWAVASGPSRYQHVLTTARAVTPPCHLGQTGRWAQEGVGRGMLSPVGSVEPQNTSPPPPRPKFKCSRWFKRSAADLSEMSYLEGFTRVHSYIIGEGTQIAM